MNPTNWIVALIGAVTLSGFAPGASGAERPSEAQVLLKRALSLDVGADGAPDAVHAFAAMRQAAQAGDPQAAFNVGVMLDSGRGSARDLSEAAIWYARAAVRGERRGAFNLGMLYESGEGVPANADLSRAWYFASNLPAARERLARLSRGVNRPMHVQAPEPLFPMEKSLVESSDHIELVWTSHLEPEPVKYFVELRRIDAGVSNELWSGLVDISSVRLSLPPSVKALAWRVAAVGKSSGDSEASNWSVFTVVGADTSSRSNISPSPQRTDGSKASRTDDREIVSTAKSHDPSERRPEAISNLPQAILEKSPSDHTPASLLPASAKPLQTFPPRRDATEGLSENEVARVAPPSPQAIPENGHSHTPALGADPSSAALHSARSVLIILAQPSVTRISELNDKAVIIAGLQSISQTSVEAAMSAAGASGAQLVEGTKNDIDKLISGKISAAIIALVSPAKAASFPEIPGFKLLRIDVSNVGLNSAPVKN